MDSKQISVQGVKNIVRKKGNKEKWEGHVRYEGVKRKKKVNPRKEGWNKEGKQDENEEEENDQKCEEKQ